MKIKIFENLFRKITIGLVLAVCVSTNLVFAKTEVLKLEVGNGGNLEIKTKSKCKSNSQYPKYQEKGCVRADKNDSLTVVFKLSGKTNKGQCTRNGNRYKYELSGIQLGGKNADDKPTLDDWNNPPEPLDVVVQADFDVADPATGWLNVGLEEDSRSGHKNLRLEDSNSSLIGYSIWYRVRATCNDPDNRHEIFYDPRIDNRGNPPR